MNSRKWLKNVTSETFCEADSRALIPLPLLGYEACPVPIPKKPRPFVSPEMLRSGLDFCYPRQGLFIKSFHFKFLSRLLRFHYFQTRVGFGIVFFRDSRSRSQGFGIGTFYFGLVQKIPKIPKSWGSEFEKMKQIYSRNRPWNRNLNLCKTLW